MSEATYLALKVNTGVPGGAKSGVGSGERWGRQSVGTVTHSNWVISRSHVTRNAPTMNAILSQSSNDRLDNACHDKAAAHLQIRVGTRLTACASDRCLAATPSFDDGYRIPATGGSGWHSLIVEHGH